MQGWYPWIGNPLWLEAWNLRNEENLALHEPREWRNPGVRSPGNAKTCRMGKPVELLQIDGLFHSRGPYKLGRCAARAHLGLKNKNIIKRNEKGRMELHGLATETVPCQGDERKGKSWKTGHKKLRNQRNEKERSWPRPGGPPGHRPGPFILHPLIS